MCSNRTCSISACNCFGIIISILFGTLVGILFAYRLLPFIAVSVWVALGLAVLALVILITSLLICSLRPDNPLRKCLCRNAHCMLAAIIGTIISALALLIIFLIPAFIPIIVLVAIGAFFFALLILNLIYFTRCLIHILCAER